MFILYIHNDFLVNQFYIFVTIERYDYIVSDLSELSLKEILLFVFILFVFLIGSADTFSNDASEEAFLLFSATKLLRSISKESLYFKINLYQLKQQFIRYADKYTDLLC